MPSERPQIQVTDPSMLRALSHPVRLALLEALAKEGPLTATEAGELVGESPANCSFHLRTLAKHGFVEEAEGGRGRQRPWRTRHMTTNIVQDDLSPEARLAAQGLFELLRNREQEWQRRFQATRTSYPVEWREAARESQFLAHLTAAELEELGKAISDLVTQYGDRDPDGQRPDALPVGLSLHAYPLRPPS